MATQSFVLKNKPIKVHHVSLVHSCSVSTLAAAAAAASSSSSSGSLPHKCVSLPPLFSSSIRELGGCKLRGVFYEDLVWIAVYLRKKSQKIRCPFEFFCGIFWKLVS
jgi:hypothetical protein